MSKTVKNILMGFTLLCIIILVIFIIELIMANRNAGDSIRNESSSSASGNTPAETGQSPDETPLSLTSNDSEAGENESPSPESPSQPTGKRYEMLISSNRKLVWYADEDLFERADMDSGEMFKYKDGENASLEMTMVVIALGVEARAESILTGYLGGNESHVGGTGSIRRSSLDGVYVSGVNDDETFEAWIHDISDYNPNRGIAFVIRYSNDEQKNALYAILDTLELAPV